MKARNAFFVFICTEYTEESCLKNGLFGLSNKYLKTVRKIRKGDKLFLLNITSDSVFGVFEAASDGEENIEPRAWGGRYPAQVKVTVDFEQLKQISNARQAFPFLKSKSMQLDDEEAEMLLKAFEKAPIIGEPVLAERKIPDSEKSFAAYLDKHKVPYLRVSQEIEDYSKALSAMKAKRPDFLILAKDKLIFVEVKPNLLRHDIPQIVIDVEEVKRLNQFQLQTGLETIIAFPFDKYGTAWQPLRPSWIVANGFIRKIENRDVYVVSARRTEELKLPFALGT